MKFEHMKGSLLVSNVNRPTITKFSQNADQLLQEQYQYLILELLRTMSRTKILPGGAPRYLVSCLQIQKHDSNHKLQEEDRSANGLGHVYSKNPSLLDCDVLDNLISRIRTLV